MIARHAIPLAPPVGYRSVAKSDTSLWRLTRSLWLDLMHTSAISERELAHNLVRKLPWLTLSIVILTFFLTLFGLNQDQDAAFSFKVKADSLTGILAFDSLTPLRHFGFTVLTSFFLHTDWNHFVSNSVWLMLLGTAIELRQKRAQLLLGLTAGHLIALLGGYVYATAFGGAPLLLGMSGGVCFVALMWLSETQAGNRSLSILLILLAMTAFQAGGFSITHGLPAVAGFVFGWRLKKRLEIQNERKSATFPLASATKNDSSKTATGA